MKIREFVLKLAALYDYPVTIQDSETGKKYDHPAIIGAEKWVDDNFIDGKILENFYNYFVNNFIKTDAVRYPSPGNFEKIYIKYKSHKKNIKPFSQIEYKPLSDEEKKEYQKKKIKFFKECPEKYLNTDIKEIKEISKRMTLDQQLDEFGFNLFGELHSEGIYSRFGKWANREKNIAKDEVRRIF